MSKDTVDALVTCTACGQGSTMQVDAYKDELYVMDAPCSNCHNMRYAVICRQVH